MAAPTIPNLNTLRGGGGGLRGRGRGRGLGSLSGPTARNTQEDRGVNDKIVQQTDQDASVSRMSAVDAGYLEDPYAKCFATSEAQRRFPIINRGTYVRTKAIDNLVDQFLESDPARKKQIVSLGAGTDTRYFRLMLQHNESASKSQPSFIYHELDFPENTARKLAELKRQTVLWTCIERGEFSSERGPTYEPSTTFHGAYYHVHPVDLRTLDSSKEPPRTFDSIDPSLPTLIISECCLCYLAPAAADTVALYFTKHFFPVSTPLGLVLYEPIRPDDPFGKVMVSNLAARGIVLQTLKKYGSLEAQAARMRAYGFEDSRGADVKQLWGRGVDEAEKERVAGLEMVDEVEEWELLAHHYCVVWGWKDGEGAGAGGIWDRWKELLR